MEFDILDLTEEEILAFSTIQHKLLRTAQQKKNELYHQLLQDCRTYKEILIANRMQNSTLYDQKVKELEEEYEYQVEIIREQLIFNMALNEPTHGGETGDSGSSNTGYIVDYELSYLQRYIQVRDYYMSIEDPIERLALYRADSVAMAYLDSYYNTLDTYLASFANGDDE